MKSFTAAGVGIATFFFLLAGVCFGSGAWELGCIAIGAACTALVLTYTTEGD